MSFPACGSTTHPSFVHPALQPSTLIPQKAAALTQAFRNFISRCDYVLSLLGAAQNIEYADSATSNYSLSGWFISSLSFQKNHQAANEVDALCAEALRINQLMAAMGLAFQPLDAYFDGNEIRRAENAEHSHPFFDWLIGGQYSSLSSMHTASQLEGTAMKIQFVRNQARCLLSSLQPIDLAIYG